MCAISGVFGEGSGNFILTMLKELEHRGPDGSGIFVDNTILFGQLENFSTQIGSKALGHNLLSIVGSDVQQPLVDGGIALVSNAEIYNFKKLKSDLDYDFKTDSDCEVILALFKEKGKGNLKDTVPEVVKYLDGDYAFIVYDGIDWAAVRDPVGVKPLYFGKNQKSGIFAMGSERKALWKIGIEHADSLTPQYMIFNQELISIRKKNELFNPHENFLREDSFSKIKDDLKNAIIDSVKKRAKGLEKVGIFFSGGVDSALLALICKQLEVDTELFTVGTPKSHDFKFSKKAADLLGLSLYSRKVDEELVRHSLPHVLEAIEEWNVMKLGVGMTAYLAAELANRHDFRVLLSGQGADEIFGGYHRYKEMYKEKGDVVEEDLKKDVENIYHVNLERDDAVTMAHGVELRVPYLDLQVLNRAMNIPMKYKINSNDDQLRKCILRELARDIGVPSEIAYRPKKAAQYGSGIHQLLVKKVLKDDEFLMDLKQSIKFI
jgi:asparagine synthase (glutamine-hydrolysing)